MEEISRSISHKESDGRPTSCDDDDVPFLRYATTSWVAHTQQCDDRSIPQDDLLALFAWPLNDLVESWVHVYQTVDCYSNHCPLKGASLVHIVSRYGVLGLLMAILKREDQGRVYFNAIDKSGRTPLTWAAENRHEAIAKLLLGTGKGRFLAACQALTYLPSS